jgi:hypothetical protein
MQYNRINYNTTSFEFNTFTSRGADTNITQHSYAAIKAFHETSSKEVMEQRGIKYSYMTG